MGGRTFRYRLRIKGVEKVFAEGFDPGVFVTQDVEFKTAPPKNEDSPRFTLAVVDMGEEILRDNVEILIEEVEV